MRQLSWPSISLLAIASAVLTTSLLHADSLQLVSARGGSVPACATGGGLSTRPVIDGSGRFVVFASTAQNLTDTNNTPVSSAFVPRFNVYRRDRLTSTTALVSESPNHQSGDGDSFPCGVSANGDRLVFVSDAANLVSNDTNGVGDVFVRDLSSGLTTLVSLGTNGAPGNGESYGPLMTPDGRYVFFSSAASNLVSGDTNGIVDVFARDLVANTTALVSTNARNSMANFVASYSEIQSITPDGRFAAYVSTATNQAPAGSLVSSNAEVYVRDLTSNTTTWVSSAIRTYLPGNGMISNAISGNAVLSADGHYVAFATLRTNGTSRGGSPANIFRRDLQTGTVDVIHTNAAMSLLPVPALANLDMTPDGRYVAFVARTNNTSTRCILLWDALSASYTLVSGSTNGLVATNSTANWPSVDTNGQHVTFISTARNLVTNNLAGGLLDEYRLYVRDLQAGTTRPAAPTTNQSAGIVSPIFPPAHLSDDGSVIAFESDEATFIVNDDNRNSDVFVGNLTGGTTELASGAAPSRLSYSIAGYNTLGYGGISTNGRYVVFVSTANNLSPLDINGTSDIFVHDLATGTNLLVSRTASASITNITAMGPSWEPVISGDGRRVAFTSTAPDLGAYSLFYSPNVYVRDLSTGQTVLVSVRTNTANTAGGGYSYVLGFSENGRHVLFSHDSGTLTSVVASGTNLFLRDLQSSNTWVLTTGGANFNPVMTPDGSRILFSGIYGSSSNRLFVWDTSAASRIYTNSASSSITPAAISEDGTKIAYLNNGTNLMMTVLGPNTNLTLANGTIRLPAVRRASRWLPYLLYNPALQAYQAYLYDFTTGTNGLIGGNWGFSGPYQGQASVPPELSSDGRYLAYVYYGTNSPNPDLNRAGDVVLYDRQTGTPLIVSLNAAGGTGNARSSQPYFSKDGKMLVFSSLAADLTGHDGNENFDIFALQLTPAYWVDADGDGMGDAWETQYLGGTNALPEGNPDGDSWNNLAEYQLGLNPTNAEAGLSASIALPNGATQPTVTWPVLPGKGYQVQFKDDLNAAWQPVTNSIYLFGTNGILYDSAVTNQPQRYYRILLN